MSDGGRCIDNTCQVQDQNTHRIEERNENNSSIGHMVWGGRGILGLGFAIGVIYSICNFLRKCQNLVIVVMSFTCKKCGMSFEDKKHYEIHQGIQAKSRIYQYGTNMPWKPSTIRVNSCSNMGLYEILVPSAVWEIL